ncbi:MAG: hypothetical protein QOJ42_7952 [Acidobacteriaceae bacterium]|jgi:hypothetical protein|nr:hypothetical protein [Acidobacteriaceae bacterium]
MSSQEPDLSTIEDALEGRLALSTSSRTGLQSAATNRRLSDTRSAVSRLSASSRSRAHQAVRTDAGLAKQGKGCPSRSCCK